NFVGDRDRLRQMLLNLVENSIKYNCPGGFVTIALRQTEHAVELEIANTGEGISSQLAPRLFQPFARGDEARSKAIEGCGLGLSICQWIVHAHGGQIQLASAPSGLTTARVRWPVTGPHHAPQRSAV